MKRFAFLFCIIAFVFTSFALDDVTKPHTWSNRDTLKRQWLNANVDTLYAAFNRLNDSLGLKFLRTSAMHDSTWDTIKTNYIRSNPNVDSLQGLNNISGNPKCDSLKEVDRISGNPVIDSIKGPINFLGNVKITNSSDAGYLTVASNAASEGGEIHINQARNDTSNSNTCYWALDVVDSSFRIFRRDSIGTYGEALRFYSTRKANFSQNVGIGKSPTQYKLDVSGRINSDSLSTGLMILQGSSSSWGLKLQSVADAQCVFLYGSAPKFAFNGIGGMHIGDTTYTGSGLAVTGSTILNYGGSASGTQIKGDNDPYLGYFDATNDRVGFGLVAPLAKVHVKGGIIADSISFDSTHFLKTYIDTTFQDSLYDNATYRASGTARIVKIGPVVTLYQPQLIGSMTGGAATYLKGIPSKFIPSECNIPAALVNNAAGLVGEIYFSGTDVFLRKEASDLDAGNGGIQNTHITWIK